MTFELAHKLFFDQFRILSDLSNRAAALIAAHANGPYLAIHYRGTDKLREVTLPSHDTFLQAFTAQAAARFPDIRTVFVATDEPEFLAAARARLNGFRIFTNEDRVIPTGHAPVHFSNLALKEPRALTEDALVNALILSRSRFLVKTPSILSGWAKVLDPNLDVLMVGGLLPHAVWFPDSLLLKHAESL